MLRAWLNDLPFTDPIQRDQAKLLQSFLLTFVVLGLLVFPSGFSAESLIDRITGVLGAALVEVSSIIGVLVLRRGQINTAVWLSVIATMVVILLNMIPTGLEGSRAVFAIATIPILLSGLVQGKSTLVATFLALVIIVVGVAVSEVTLPEWVGYSPDTYDPALSTVTFVVSAAVLSVMVYNFGEALRRSLRASLNREHELELLKVSLEQQVALRTTELARALHSVEEKAAEQGQLLSEIESQRSLIRELSVPILPVSSRMLVMPLVGALDSDRLLDVQNRALEAIERSNANLVLLDVTGVPVVDTHVAKGLISVVQSARLLGSDVVLIGIRPEVAQTIVTLGVDLSTVHTARDLQSVLALK